MALARKEGLYISNFALYYANWRKDYMLNTKIGTIKDSATDLNNSINKMNLAEIDKQELIKILKQAKKLIKEVKAW
jgi:hypothetical protein